MGIACMKAVLVVLIFMGVAYTTKFGQALGHCGLFVANFFLFGVLIDYNTRGAEPIAGYPQRRRVRHSAKAGDRTMKNTPGDDSAVEVHWNA